MADAKPAGAPFHAVCPPPNANCHAEQALLRALGPKSKAFSSFSKSFSSGAQPRSSVTAFGSEPRGVYFDSVIDAVLKRFVNVERRADCDHRCAGVIQQIDDAVSHWLEKFGSTPIESDCFRALYEELFQREARHSRGEFYTPDWLVDLALDRSGYDGQLAIRVVDPACGSGAFLVRAIRRLRRRCAEAGLSNDSTLELVCSNVVGLDPNQRAIRAATANFYLAVHDLLTETTQVAPPIHRCDLIEAAAADPPFDSHPATGTEQCILHHAGTFDLVVGNPPWVGWETMPVEYRRRTTSFWKRYGLFRHSGMAAILGAGKKDLAMLLSLAATDRLLAAGGNLAFVLSRSLLTSASASAFRDCCLTSSAAAIPLQVISVDDVSDFRPFTQAAAKPIVLVWRKGKPTSFPVPFRIWRKSGKLRPGPSPSLETVASASRHIDHLAAPMDESQPRSRWLNSCPGIAAAVRKLLGPSDYRAYEGVNTGGANGVYFVERIGDDDSHSGLSKIRNLADCGKKRVESVKTDIESDLVFPLLRGVEVRRWTTNPSASILLVQDVDARRGMNEREFRLRFPHGWKYFSRFERLLRSRRMYNRYFQKRGAGDKTSDAAPFYSMFNVGRYTLAPYKVVWHRMVAPIQAAVCIGEDKPILPQETHAFVPCDSVIEAHYLAALLNSSLVGFVAHACCDVGGKSFATPGLLELVRVPRFDPTHSGHLALAGMASELFDLAARPPIDHAIEHEIESHIDSCSARIWDLGEDEMRRIRRCWLEHGVGRAG